MHELKRTEFERARPLFRKMDIHLPLQAILAGNVNAPIYVDNPAHPQSALTWTGHRFYLAGAPGNNDFIVATRQIFLEKFALRAQKSGIDSYLLHYPSKNWKSTIAAILLEKYPIQSQREYYAFNKSSHIDWRAQLPPELSLRNVDAVLLAERRWENPEFLTEEMCSERESVEDFLDKSFGVSLVSGNEIIGWCLSEYNTGHRCEVGIATREDYQQRGLATLMAAAFIELARSKDVARVGWHCSASNVGSGKTALKAGFEKVADYDVYFGWFDDATNIARNGYFAFGRGEYAEALGFYEKSFTLGEAPDWAYWGATCAAAMVSQNDKALKYLSGAVEHGFDDLEHVRNSKYLVGLHETDGWKSIIAGLEQLSNAN